MVEVCRTYRVWCVGGGVVEVCRNYRVWCVGGGVVEVCRTYRVRWYGCKVHYRGSEVLRIG